MLWYGSFSERNYGAVDGEDDDDNLDEKKVIMIQDNAIHFIMSYLATTKVPLNTTLSEALPVPKPLEIRKS